MKKNVSLVVLILVAFAVFFFFCVAWLTANAASQASQASIELQAEYERGRRDEILYQRDKCWEVQHGGKRMLWYKAGGRQKNGKIFSKVEWVLLEEVEAINHHPADEERWWSDHWGDLP